MHGGTRHIFTCVCKTQCASVQSVATLRHWQEERVCRYFCRQLHGKITMISLRRTATVSIGLPTEVDSKAIVITKPHRMHASHSLHREAEKKEPAAYIFPFKASQMCIMCTMQSACWYEWNSDLKLFKKCCNKRLSIGVSLLIRLILSLLSLECMGKS